MNIKTLIEKVRAFRKGVKLFKNESRIEDCFHYNKAECSGAIKQAHSIQRNGRLSLIEGDVNGNKMIYTSTSYDADDSYPIKTLVPVGKKEASTFYGFCDYHDTHLFSPIENFSFEDTDKQCFLHSYRSLAHTYHRKKEEYKILMKPSQSRDIHDPFVLMMKQRGVEIGMADLERERNRLNILLNAEEYDGLIYYTMIFPDRYPIAFAGAFNPYFSTNGRVIIDKSKVFEPDAFKTMMLTVLPDLDSTIIIFACFAEDVECVMYIDELESMPEERRKRAISSAIISAGENFFMAPAVWNALGPKGQRSLCDELISIVRDVPMSFHKSRICFFDPRFSRKRLGLA
jgi:hypothetical protein